MNLVCWTELFVFYVGIYLCVCVSTYVCPHSVVVKFLLMLHSISNACVPESSTTAGSGFGDERFDQLRFPGHVLNPRLRYVMIKSKLT